MNLQEMTSLLHLLWVLPLFAGLTTLGMMRRKRLLARSFPDTAQRASVMQGISIVKRRLRWGLLTLTLIGTVLALSRPQYGHSDLGLTSSGGDITIVLDVSRSIYARDIKPDRLTVAKNLIQDLVAALPSHRFSLIVFAGKAYTACPMTGSRTSFLMILNDVSPITMPYGGTNLEEALRESLKAADTAETANRSVVIFSDGDVQQGAFDQVLADYKQGGIPIMTVGLGVPGSKSLIQLPDNSFIRFNETLVRSSLNAAPLKALAEGTGGYYWQASDEPVLPERIATTLRETATAKGGSSRISRPTERYQWPLACALLFLGAAILINDKKRLAATMAAALVILPVLVNAAEDLPEAVVRSELAMDSERNPVRKTTFRYRLAVELQAYNLTDQAITHYKQVILSNHADDQLRVAAMRNLAVIYFSNGTDALKETPADSISAFNNVIVLSKTILETQYNEDVVKMLEAAHVNRNRAEMAFRRQEEQKRLKQNAVQAVKSAADAQNKATKTPGSEAQEKADTVTKQAQSAASKLEDERLDSFMNRAVASQASLQKPENRPHADALRKDAFDALVQALQHLGITYKKPEQNDKQAGTPPKELPKDLQFEKETDKKKRAIMILRAMRKEEENQRKEIRNAREKAFRARLGEERDW